MQRPLLPDACPAWPISIAPVAAVTCMSRQPAPANGLLAQPTLSMSSDSQQQGPIYLWPGCRLCHVQATAAAPHLRTCWRQHYESHAYDEFRCEWQKALQIMGAACKLD